MPKKKPLLGRPPKPAGEKFVTPFRQFRMSDDDWALVVAAAGERSVSEFIRETLLARAKRLTSS